MAENIDIRVRLQGAKEASTSAKQVSQSIRDIGKQAGTTSTKMTSASHSTKELNQSTKQAATASKDMATQSNAAATAATAVGAKVGGAGKATAAASGASAKAAGKMGLLSKVMRSGALRMAGVVGGAYGVGKAALYAVKQSSDLGEVISKTGAVFRKSQGTVLSWSKNSAQAMGMSRSAALEAAGGFGSMLVAMGTTDKEAAKMSMRFTQLSADLASQHNKSQKEVSEALQAGLTGEAEPMKRLGSDIRVAALDAFAKNKGMKKTFDAMDSQQKQQLIYQKILHDTRRAHGDYQKTQDSLANRVRTLKAQFNDIAAALGNYVKPTLEKVLKVVSVFLAQMKSGKGAGGDFARAAVSGFRALTTAIVVWWKVSVPIWKVEIQIIRVAISVVRTLARVFIASGRGIVRAVKTGLWPFIFAVRTSIRLIGIFTSKAIPVWGRLQAAVMSVGPVLKKVFNPLWESFKSVINKIKGLWSSVANSGIGKILGLGGAAPTPALGAVRPPVSGGRGGPTAKAAGGLVTNTGRVLVGERGPEIVHLPASARVNPLPGAGQVAALSSSLLNVQVPVSIDGKQVAHAVGRATVAANNRR